MVEVAERAMAVSISAGVAACPPGAVMIHLADMPEIGADDLAAVSAAWRRGSAHVLRAASADGRPGHPVVFDASLRPALEALRGDVGAQAVLAGRKVEVVRLAGRRALIDLDTPEAWAAWAEARRSQA